MINTRAECSIIRIENWMTIGITLGRTKNKVNSALNHSKILLLTKINPYTVQTKKIICHKSETKKHQEIKHRKQIFVHIPQVCHCFAWLLAEKLLLKKHAKEIIDSASIGLYRVWVARISFLLVLSCTLSFFQTNLFNL